MNDFSSHDQPQIKAVAFDMGGLMFNTESLYNEVGDEICRRRGKTFEEKLRREMMGQPGRVSLQIMIDYFGWSDTVEGLAGETREIFLPLIDARLDVMPGLIDLLHLLENVEVPRALATSSSRWFADILLGRFDLHPKFSFLLTAEDVVNGKPHPEIYVTAARRHGVRPEELLVLEDSGNGCRAAVAAGAYAVAVPGDHSMDHDFSGVKFIANSLADKRILRLFNV